jgi:hypothetical protein
MAIYGIPGDPTYSETLSGLDEILSVLPTQDTGSITARNLRDVSFTLWEEISGLSTWSFSYTSLTPSTVELGGIVKGTTFSYVSLEEIFDRMFLKFQDSEYELSILAPNPPIYEYGYLPGGTATIDLQVTLTKNTNPIVSCTLSVPNDLPSTVSPTIPTSGSTISTFQASIIPNTTTTYTLTLSDFNGTTGLSGRQISVTMSWYNSRYYGTIDLSSIGPYTDIRNITASQSIQLDSLISTRFGLTGPNGLSDLTSSPYKLLGTSISLLGTASHLVVAWPSSDWTYSVFPKTTYNNFYVNMFKKIESSYYLENVWGYGEYYDIYMSHLPQGNTEITILNQQQ